MNGNTLTIRIPAGQCLNDLKVTFASGQSLERLQLNTCQVTDVNLN